MRCDALVVSDPRWRELLRSMRHDVYHAPEYVEIEARRGGHQAGALVVTDGDRLLFLPYLLRNASIGDDADLPHVVDLVSPYGYPGILASAGAGADRRFVADAMRLILEHLRAQGVCSAFLRLHPVLSPELGDLELPDVSLRRTATVAVLLEAPEAEIWAHTRKGHQSTINRCVRLGQHARIASWSEHGAAFRQIYRETMDQAAAADHYYFDEAYFDELQRLGDGIHLCVVESGGEITAACLLFECCGIVHAHLGGTRDGDRAGSPFSLLLHFTRLWAKARGNQVLHLGGGVGGADDPVFHYKSGFSRDRLEYVTAQVVIDRARYEELVEARARWLQVPVASLRSTGFFPSYRGASSGHAV